MRSGDQAAARPGAGSPPLSGKARGSCFHCGAPLPEVGALAPPGSGGTAEFCCHACLGAYLLISGAGLGDFYRRRKPPETGEAAPTSPTSYGPSYLSRFVQASPKGSSIDIVIDGIRCASCAWLNERILERLEGVREARVNYATGRARVLFDPGLLAPAGIFSRIAAIGYLPRPYTRGAAGEAAGRERRDLLYRFGTALFLGMQLMAYSLALYAGYFQSISAPMKGCLQLFSLLVTTPVLFYCGRPFLSGAWRALCNRAPDMDLLIAIGALSSYGYSLYTTFAGGEVYFETAAMIVTLILAGRLLEHSARRRAASGVEALLGLCAGEARRVRGDLVERVDPSELCRGEVIEVAPGERFPVDGTIVEGKTDVDQSPVTGEPLPLLKSAGDRVLAGSANLTGTVRLTCDREAAESYLARVARLVEEAQSRRPPIQLAADRVSRFFVPAVLALSLATFIRLCLTGAPCAAALMSALSVLLIACPCAVGLATPTAIVAGTGAAALQGVIFRGGDVLERLSRVDLAVFDKTGTLTRGRPELAEIRAARGDPRQLLALAASVERGSLHPIGRALLEEAAARALAIPPGEELRSVAGGGVTGRVAGEPVAVGSLAFLAGLGVSPLPGGIPLPPGALLVGVARSGRYLGAIILRDRLRDDAPGLVSSLAGRGIRTLLLSGDRQEAAEEAAAGVGIGAALGGLSPAGKRAHVERLRLEGRTVLMVGDGINDAPALSAADVGCAVAGGAEIAIESSDLLLVKPDLERLASAHRMARRTMKVVRQNLAWAFLYNLVGIPLAMTGRLTPVYAAAAMALSSLCVVGNSLRLLRRKDG